MSFGIDNIAAIGDSVLGAAGAIPVVGNVISGVGAAGHGIGAIYDGVTGDRDGAVGHLAQAAWGVAGMFPGVSQVAAVGSGLGAVNRIHTAATGGDASTSYGGFGDLFQEGAVGLTNAIFGPDDSNWIADGNAPTGSGRTEGAISSVAGLASYLLGGGPAAGSPTSGARGPGGAARAPGQQFGDDVRGIPAYLDREIRRLYGAPF